MRPLISIDALLREVDKCILSMVQYVFYRKMGAATARGSLTMVVGGYDYRRQKG